MTTWKTWGPYLSERAWGTVREDYSATGDAWAYFPHDHARSRAYRWNEDGLAGLCDDKQYLCLALALWNGRDPILKERLFGLAGPEGNHGEDVKEAYFYLESSPDHRYMKMLYKYPQATFPYAQLVEENRRRGYQQPEYEVEQTGIFDDGRYFDVFIEYAKPAPDDILMQIRVVNRGPDPAPCSLLPTLWFRNTWAWGYPNGPLQEVIHRPRLRQVAPDCILAEHPILSSYYLYADSPQALLFTENETNQERLYQQPNPSPYVKDAFHRYLIKGQTQAVNPHQVGTKACAVYQHTLAPGAEWIVRLRLSHAPHKTPFEDFESALAAQQAANDAFYQARMNPALSREEQAVFRQALAGMLWSKQLYYYDVEQWLAGDPNGPPPPPQRQQGRNSDWQHLNNYEVISMPDKWEYPWYAGWDLAFHCLPLALVDPEFAKDQLLLLTREWYMHPNGQLPAYEWAFGDVNPPVHAWAAMQVYRMEIEAGGRGDLTFLKRVFHKLLQNFTWWVNRKDAEGRNLFQGGFLGLDNISLFDRSAPLPTGGHLNQSDGTAWMGFYCLTMLDIALELARQEAAYEDMTLKFFEHFLSIAVAMSGHHRHGVGLWDEADGFFYDSLSLPDGTLQPLKVRSLVGLMPLLAVETVSPQTLAQLPDFARSIRWMVQHRPHLTGNMAAIDLAESGEAFLYAIPTRERLVRVLAYMLDEREFLSPYGIRSLSKIHAQQPYHLALGGQSFTIQYQPTESDNGLFGGNSNWRGPIWFPLNYLLIQALRRYDRYYGTSLTVEFPTGSGHALTLGQVADQLSQRLINLFLPEATGRRPIFGDQSYRANDPHWRDYVLFYEYFHGDQGAGLGASHQTGWTGLVANLLHQKRP
jgi:hypothetical protein